MGERPRSEMLPPRDPRICLGFLLLSSVSCTSSSSYLLRDWTTHFSLPLHSLPNVTLLSHNSQQPSQCLPSPLCFNFSLPVLVCPLQEMPIFSLVYKQQSQLFYSRVSVNTAYSDSVLGSLSISRSSSILVQWELSSDWP